MYSAIVFPLQAIFVSVDTRRFRTQLHVVRRFIASSQVSYLCIQLTRRSLYLRMTCTLSQIPKFVGYSLG